LLVYERPKDKAAYRLHPFEALSVCIQHCNLTWRQEKKGKAGTKVRVFLISMFAPILGC